MSLIEKLTEQDRNMIETYIDNFAGGDCSRVASIDHILRFWDQNKSKYLANLFGGKLIVTKTVTFKQDIDETAEEVRKIVMHNKTANEFLCQWRSAFGWYNEDLQYLDEKVRYNLYDMPNWHNLAVNRWEYDTFVVPFPDGTTLKIQRGTKVTKAMAKIAKAFDLYKYGFEEFRIACSQGLNQKEITGELTLSIHPLDYMTMSDNDCDWSSCMSWRDNGCYRQGTVEMMNSPMVVVAYLAAEDTKLHFGGMKKYEWNSKKWRELMIVTPDIICNVLGYPYRNEFLSQAAITMLKEMAEANTSWKYQNEKPVLWHQNEPVSVYPDAACKTKINTETCTMYNDFGDKDHYGYFSSVVGNREDFWFNYSGPSECLCCGQEDPEIEDESFLVGNCCDEVCYCDCCGERIYEDDGYWIDDMHLCEYCMQDRTGEDIFGRTHFDDNLRSITILNKENKTGCERVFVYWGDWDWSVLKRYFKRLIGYRRYDWHPIEYFVYADDLTEKGADIFCETACCDTLDDLLEYSFRYGIRETLDPERVTEYLPEGKPLRW